MLLWQLGINVQSFVPHVLQCYSAMKTTTAETQNEMWLYKEPYGFKLDDYGLTTGSCCSKETHLSKSLLDTNDSIKLNLEKLWRTFIF